jgi:peroxiredoxin
MKKIPLLLLLICLLSEQQVNAQDETQVAAILQQRQKELYVVWGPAIETLKERYANGDKTVGDSIEYIVDSYRKIQVETSKKFMLDYPNTETAAGLIWWFYYDAPFDTLISVYDKLGPVAKKSQNGLLAAGFIERGKKVLPGKEAPLFSHPDTSGMMVHLKDYRGKYVLLEFWAHWCVPCRAENPNLKNAYSKYNAKGFEILGISMDKEKEKQDWKEAIIKDGLPWKQVSDLKGIGNEVFTMYNVQPIPDNYLIDPEGKIVARGIRGEALQEKLASIFNSR